MDEIIKLQKLINQSNHIVFFGGAGVSTESGIPDFRSAKGIFNEKTLYPAETIVSHSFFFEKPFEFYQFYKEKMIYLEAEPNECHKKLFKLEEAGKLSAIVTQNIDGLHQMAGSINVLELHGTIHKNHCLVCGRFYGLERILESDIPHCDCGGMVKPDVVLYEEALDNDILLRSIEAIKNADLLIVGGTSLSVYPASSLIYYYPKGKPLVLINKDLTGRENLADLVIQAPIGEVFSKIKVD
ncbi:MAG: NAD-dependent protein deacylase [Acholeplasmataceae bacterium]|nr:NAD-dependent protein deacylase [Acholeplasmataceae bacterium]